MVRQLRGELEELLGLVGALDEDRAQAGLEMPFDIYMDELSAISTFIKVK